MSNDIAFRGSSSDERVDFLVLEKDDLGWKLDVHTRDGCSVSDGDTYQDSLDQLMPFLKKFVDKSTEWRNYDTGEVVSFWDVASSYFEALEA